FLASADPLGTNSKRNCQLFSIDTVGAHQRQLTTSIKVSRLPADTVSPGLRQDAAFPVPCGIGTQAPSCSSLPVIPSAPIPTGTSCSPCDPMAPGSACSPTCAGLPSRRTAASRWSWWAPSTTHPGARRPSLDSEGYLGRAAGVNNPPG